MAISVENLQNNNGTEPPKRMGLSGKKLGIIFAVGIIAIILGATTGGFWMTIYNYFFTKEFTLTESSKIYDIWQETPIPMYLKFHMFNWTNPDQFGIPNGEKPNFIEMGPYVFREIDYKVNQEWNSNGTVTFQRRKVWFFEESLSNGSLSDEVTNLNPVAATVAFAVRSKSKFVRDLINRFMISLGERRTVTKTVKELLFEGYNDTMLLIAKKFQAGTIPFDKFGWFYTRNGSDTYEGIYNMLTGQDNLYTLGDIQQWKYSDTYKPFAGKCGEIRGSLGDLWPPLLDNKTVSIFIPDICTHVDLNYENDSIYEGLTGKTFTSDESMLDNGTLVTSRSCYCRDVECSPSGVLNVSSCLYGAPAFLSAPHFYLGDPSYRDGLTGLKPSKELHQSSLTLEPTTGIPMIVSARMQINLLIQPDSVMSMFKDIPKIYMPMFWFTQEAKLTSSLASQVKFLLILPLLGQVTLFGIAAIGALVFLIGVIICLRQKWKGEEGQVLISKNESNSVKNTGA